MSGLWPRARKFRGEPKEPLADLQDMISEMVEASRTRELRDVQRDLRLLVNSIDELVTALAKEKAYGTKGSGGVKKALEEMRSRVEAKGPPKGMGVVESMAAWILRN